MARTQRGAAILLAAVAAAAVLAGCMGRAPAGGSEAGASATSEPAGDAASEGGMAAIAPYLPATASYRGPEDFVSTWTVTDKGQGVYEVKDTVGDVDTVYTVEVEDGCLVQTSQLTPKGEPDVFRATWFCVPPRAFANDYELSGTAVRETAAERWTTDEKLGQVLEVTKTVERGGATYTVVERWAAGLGLVSRVTTDAQGRVVERREIIFAGS